MKKKKIIFGIVIVGIFLLGFVTSILAQEGLFAPSIKKNIVDVDIADTDKLLQLSPRTYYRIDIDLYETGLIAEEVAEINPNWVVYDYVSPEVSEAVPYLVRYQDIAMVTLLLIQKQQTQIEAMAQALCEMGREEFCGGEPPEPDPKQLYYCEVEDVTRECPGGIGGTTRCYLDETKTTWDSCSSGWVLQ